MHIKDRTFIVSGGSSGLGLASAIVLLQNGANVSVLDLNPPPEGALLDTCQVLFTKTNVALTNSLQNAVKKTVDWALETSKPLSGVICCAGIAAPALSLPKQDSSATHESLEYYDMAGFDKTIAVNLRGTVDLIRLSLPHMALNKPWGDDGERGIVVVVSSIAAYEGQVGQLAYSASKGGVSSIVLPLARELGQRAGVRVMGVAPGVFQTGMSLPRKQPRDANSEDTTHPSARSRSRVGMNTEMIQYPKRMGQGHEFARLVKEIVENPMLNGFVIRLDGAVRMPARI